MATFMAVRSGILPCYFILVIYIILCVSNSNAKYLEVLEGDIGQGCQALLENFAATVGLYTFCVISHARPIKMCEKCIDTYLNVVLAHDAIVELEDHSGLACKPELINLDRLEVIESTFANVNDLWTRGNCNNCFVLLNNQVTSALTNETKEFQTLYTETDACFQMHANKSSSNSSLTKDEICNSSMEVCVECRAIYCKMNDFYDSIKETESKGEICIDVVDAMNTTRTTWSQSYGCTVNEMQADVTFILTACGVIFVTVTFYILARIFSIKPESKLLQQSRLAGQFSTSQSPPQSYLQPSTSRVFSR